MVEEAGACSTSKERAATRRTESVIRNFILIVDSWVLCYPALYSTGVVDQELHGVWKTKDSLLDQVV